MAGGVGSRFWPMSTTTKPKQFIDVLGVGRSLLQLTFDRFKGICDPENVWVVTNKGYYEIVKQQLPEIPEHNILCEPCRRNTAPCIAYVSWMLYPDGRYFADEDGFGMEDNDEVNISAYIDTQCRVVVKFQDMEDSEKRKQLREEALKRLF